MSIKKEIYAAAVAVVKCPSCGAEPRQHCRQRSRGRAETYPIVTPHQRRLSTYCAEHLWAKK